MNSGLKDRISFAQTNQQGFGTRAVHAGVQPDPTTGAIMTPIYQTSTYVQSAPGKHKGFAYARGKNPTRSVLQETLASLENGRFAVCFSSGMAAMDAVMRLLKPGDEVLASNDLYGGTYRLFMQVFAPIGVKFRFLDMSDPALVKQHLHQGVKMVWIETPTNPLMHIVDIEAITHLLEGSDALTVVDNTFASPYLQNPLELGADVVIHSITKYLGGHSDVVMGGAVVNEEALYEHLSFIQNACGAVPGPQDCFLTLRGIKTLHLRMRAHCENGAQVAHFLCSHPMVGRVHWPGFESHPNHEVAKRQMRDFGGMLSFELKDGSMNDAIFLMQHLKLFALAESLGGVESLIGHPASMTHASIPREERLATGLTDTLMRLSVGIEDAKDLVGDLAQALEALAQKGKSLD